MNKIIEDADTYRAVVLLLHDVCTQVMAPWWRAVTPSEFQKEGYRVVLQGNNYFLSTDLRKVNSLKRPTRNVASLPTTVIPVDMYPIYADMVHRTIHLHRLLHQYFKDNNGIPISLTEFEGVSTVWPGQFSQEPMSASAQRLVDQYKSFVWLGYK